MEFVGKQFPSASSTKQGHALDGQQQSSSVPAPEYTQAAGIPQQSVAATPGARRRLFPLAASAAPEPGSSGTTRPPLAPPPPPLQPPPPPPPLQQAQQRPLQIGRTSLLKWSPAGSLSSLLAAVQTPPQAVQIHQQQAKLPPPAPVASASSGIMKPLQPHSYPAGETGHAGSSTGLAPRGSETLGPDAAVGTPRTLTGHAGSSAAAAPPAGPTLRSSLLPPGLAAGGHPRTLTEEVQAVQRALLGALSGGNGPAGPAVPPRRQYRPAPLWAKAFPK